jgi:hypothetical protein
MYSGCLQIFLKELPQAYSDDHLLIVLDGAPLAPLRNLSGRLYKSEDKQDFSQQEVGEKQAAGQRPLLKKRCRC